MSLNVQKLQEYINSFPYLEEEVRRVDRLFKGRYQNTIEYAQRVANVKFETAAAMMGFLQGHDIAEVRYVTRCPETKGNLKLFMTKEEAAEPIECDLCGEEHSGETVHTVYIVDSSAPQPSQYTVSLSVEGKHHSVTIDDISLVRFNVAQMVRPTRGYISKFSNLPTARDIVETFQQELYSADHIVQVLRNKGFDEGTLANIVQSLRTGK